MNSGALLHPRVRGRETLGRPGPITFRGMTIRWDSLLVRYLARELHDRLSGCRLRAIRFDARTRDAVLLFGELSLVWRLHPDRSTVLVRPAVAPTDGDQRVKLRLRDVDAPDDERIIRFAFEATKRLPAGMDLIVELIGNRMNAVVADRSTGTVRHVLRRQRGARPLAVGSPYEPPDPTGREGIDGSLSEARWCEILEPFPPPDRHRELVRRIAWTSPLNADAFLGSERPGTEPGSGDALRRGYARWTEVARGTRKPEPTIITTSRGPQPYPFRLGGAESASATSLLDAFERVTGTDSGTPEPALVVPPALLERLDQAIVHLERRLTGLQAELDRRDDPDVMRRLGDLILARFSELRPGSDKAVLNDFDGEPVEVALDPERAPHENAASYYDRAARSERAAQRIPALMMKARVERDRLRSLRTEAAAGKAGPSEVRASLPDVAPEAGRGAGVRPLPYRTFRSSGGLEIRVGRGAKHNDDLTFRHSSPRDIWLHARHTAGAHVILRWPSDDNPPPRDLAQAGALAALHSKARTSASVPVDWTRRKYVRKPRGAPPGAVVPDRVQTLFVRPDEAMLTALADE